MKTWAAIFAAVTLATSTTIAVAAPGGSHAVDGAIDDWVGVSSMLAGRTALSMGELIYQDHIYDDYGGLTFDAAAPQRTAVEPTHGGYRYPDDDDRYANNAADLFQLRLTVEGDTVHVLAWLNTLRERDTTIVSVGFDVDGDGTQEGLVWPHQANLHADGVDVVASAWGTGGDVIDLVSGEVTALAAVAADVDENTIEFAIPRTALSGASWSIWAATGLWDEASGAFMEIPSGERTATRPGNGGNGSVGRAFNVAFRDREEGTYFENLQGDAIREGDITAFAASVSVERMIEGESDPAPRLRPGAFQAVIVDEGVTIGQLAEGAVWEGVPARQGGVGPLQESAQFQFLGRHQPYGIYVPASAGSDPLPAALVLHGAGGSHSSFNRQPGFIRDMGESTDYPPLALITPLARGESFYVDYGERSTLLALDDAAARLPLDPERLYVTGYSMGGYGALRLAMRYPDRFAAGISWAGFTGEYLGTYDLTEPLDYDELTGDPGGLRRDYFQPYVGEPLGSDGESRPVEYQAVNGDPVRNLESFRHLPFLQLGGTNDEIVPVSGQLAAAKRFEDLRYRHRFDLYPGYEHFTFALVDDWKVAREWLGDRRRPVRPRRVVFSTSPAWVNPAIEVDLGLPEPKAWWVGGLQVRDGVDDVHRPGRVDATSMAIGERDVIATPLAEGSLLPTPNARLGTTWTEGAPLRVANELWLKLENLNGITIDLAEAGLDARCLTATVVTDGPVTLRLSGSREIRFVTDSAGEFVHQGPCPAPRVRLGADDRPESPRRSRPVAEPRV